MTGRYENGQDGGGGREVVLRGFEHEMGVSSALNLPYQAGLSLQPARQGGSLDHFKS